MTERSRTSLTGVGAPPLTFGVGLLEAESAHSRRSKRDEEHEPEKAGQAVMNDIRVRFLGTGGPFASGGRLQSCILLDLPGGRVLLDCGATALVSLARYEIDPDGIDAVLLTHLHGDHFGGLPFLIVEMTAESRIQARGPRSRPLIIAGPAETEARLEMACAAFGYPQFHERARKAGLLRFVTLEHRQPVQVGPVCATAYPVDHTPEATALRLECAERSIAYSGDTAWTDALVEASADADLFICVAYTYDSPSQAMLSHRELLEQQQRLTCRRLVLTHIGPEMQRHLAEAGIEVAEDGQVIEL